MAILHGCSLENHHATGRMRKKDAVYGAVTYGPLQPWFDKSWKPGDFIEAD